MPFTSFPGLCVLQRKNGLEGIDKTYMNDKAASTFIDKMMGADLVKVQFMFSQFFCVLSDTSTDQSSAEKEILYIRYGNF